MERERRGEESVADAFDQGLPDHGRHSPARLQRVHTNKHEAGEELFQGALLQHSGTLETESTGLSPRSCVAHGQEGASGVHPGGGLNNVLSPCVWTLFADYLPAIVPGYVCLNNLAHILGPMRTAKAAMVRIGVDYVISRTPVGSCDDVWRTGGPKSVRVRGLKDAIGVYAHAASGPCKVKENLVIVRAVDVQRLLVMTQVDLACEFVRLTNAAQYTDIIGMACALSGINSS